MNIVVEKKLTCASRPQALWCVITDTERLNRAVGLGRLELSENDDATAARYVVDTVSAGFPLQYEERPYEWVENETFCVRRDVRKGAAKRIDNFFGLVPRGEGGTELTVRITVEPRFAVLAPFIRVQVRRFVQRVVDELRAVDESLAAGRPASFQQDGARVHAKRLARAVERLRASVPDNQQAVAGRLGEMLKIEPDAAVDRIRPLELAARWDLDGRAVLGACLTAVQAGLLELRWDLICPSCMTASDRIGTLADVGDAGHCQLCDITYDLSLDRSVEATFRPAEGIRQLDEGPYCIGGPARTPHVTTQAILPASGEVSLRGPEVHGDYRLFVRGGAHASILIREGGAERVVIDASTDGADLGAHTLGSSAAIVVRQRANVERHVKLERVGWKAHAASAAIVSTIPEFRRLFSSDVLRSGMSLKVGRMSLLFTDLTASTQLYRDVGDASAFKIVQDHFDLLERLVADGRGAIVKTMGDAVMAVFMAEADAIHVAVAIHEAFPGFRSERDAARRCFVKVGVYAGPCYAVTANGSLDYFGQTVNVAARLQAQALGGEIVMTEETWQAEGAAILAGHAHERFEADLKGVGRVPAIRVRLDGESGGD